MAEPEVRIKTYNDSYLYSKYPDYTKAITHAIMQDDIIDKKTAQFQDVIYEIKRARVSDSLVRILTSSNVVLLDCANPMPRAFKVFCARDHRSMDKKLKIFIDCTGVITKSKTSSDLIVDESKLISYLINAGLTMIYHKANSKIMTRTNIINEVAICFAKLFTHIIDYLLKISIQESSKNKVLYLSSLYFLRSILELGEDKAISMAKTIANINDRESMMLNILINKAEGKDGKFKSFENVNTFIKMLREVMHFNSKAISTDIVVEKWMQMYGAGTGLGLEYFPNTSAIMTDAYVGGYLNSQKAIESVCKVNMVNYSKLILNLLDSVV